MGRFGKLPIIAALAFLVIAGGFYALAGQGKSNQAVRIEAEKEISVRIAEKCKSSLDADAPVEARKAMEWCRDNGHITNEEFNKGLLLE